jgi:ribosomal protein S14
LKYFLPKDKRNRYKSISFEQRRFILKAISSSKLLPEYIRNSAKQGLCAFKKYSISSKIYNRCLKSGKAKSVYKTFRLSRSAL